jgi:hypothetical protein
MFSPLMLTLALTVGRLVNGQSTTTNDDQWSRDLKSYINKQSQLVGQLSQQLTLIARKLDVITQSVVNETCQTSNNPSATGWNEYQLNHK